MNDVLLLMLRRLRAPMLALIVVYGIAVGGLTLMPGQLPDGTPSNLSGGEQRPHFKLARQVELD